MAQITTVLSEKLHTKTEVTGAAAPICTQYMDPTDLPKPGDVLGAALGACMLTMAGAVAAKRGDDLSGAKLEIDPVFDERHTRVLEMKLTFTFPPALTPEKKDFYAKMAQTCPVHNSLREDIKYTVRVV